MVAVKVVYVTPREEWLKKADALLLAAGWERVDEKTPSEVLTRRTA